MRTKKWKFFKEREKNRKKILNYLNPMKINGILEKKWRTNHLSRRKKLW